MKFTMRQISDMKHTLRNGNRFCSSLDDESWAELVKNGLATMHKSPLLGEKSRYFMLTEEGIKAAKEFTS